MRVFATRRDDQVSVILGNKHYKRSGQSGMDLFNAVMAYKKNPTDETLEAVHEIINPYLKYAKTGVIREKEGTVYLGQSEIPLPMTLAKTIMEYLDNGHPIEPLVNFWHWCLLNPNTTARDGFFEYCQEYGVTITDSGMAVLYKAVTHKEDNRAFDLAHYVATEWLQKKRNGENPDEYIVLKHAHGFSVDDFPMGEIDVDNYLGTLGDLFVQIQSQELKGRTIYTDKHSRSMDIKLGVPVFKERDQCDPNIRNECSYGLHVGSFQYVHRFGYGEDTVFACLVNPMNVVALPHYDNSKIRVCEYYPYAIMNRRDGTDWEELPSSFFEGEYTPYSARALQSIEDDLVERLEGVDMETDAFKLITEQQAVVRTKLQSIYDMDPDILDLDVPDPIEAPFEETYFDVDDAWAENQFSNGADAAPGDNLHWFNERGKDAWKNAIEVGNFTGSLAEFMDTYSENEEEDEDFDICSDCGEYEDDCYCSTDCPECEYGPENCQCDSTYITEEEARAIWRKAICSREWDNNFSLFVEDYLASKQIYIHSS